jgi:CrcB protein
VSRLVLVCVGGALGTGVRYLATALATHWWGLGFPYGTLAVNLAGAFVIGLVQHLAAVTLIPEGLRLFLAAGVLGGMTTYSSFAFETVRLMTLAEWGKVGANLVLTNVLSLALCWLGMLVGRGATGPAS